MKLFTNATIVVLLVLFNVTASWAASPKELVRAEKRSDIKNPSDLEDMIAGKRRNDPGVHKHASEVAALVRDANRFRIVELNSHLSDLKVGQKPDRIKITLFDDTVVEITPIGAVQESGITVQTMNRKGEILQETPMSKRVLPVRMPGPLGIDVETSLSIDQDGSVSIPNLYHRGRMYRLDALKIADSKSSRKLHIVIDRDPSRILGNLKRKHYEPTQEDSGKTSRAAGNGLNSDGVYDGLIMSSEEGSKP